MRHCLVNKRGLYYITFTCFKWLSLIDITNSYDLIYKWFDILIKNGHAIVGYVIMPNHVHFIMHYGDCKQSLNTIIGNGKRFIAYKIVRRLKKQKNI